MTDVIRVRQNTNTVVTKKSDHIVKVYDTGVISTGSAGVSSHPDLTNRTAADSHPISAVTGLQAALDSKAAVITNDSIPYSQIQNVTATSRFLGRKTAGAGDIEELSNIDAKTILAISTSDVSGLGTMATQSSSSYALTGQTFYLGTTQVAINRSSASIALTGITSIDGSAASATTATNATNTGTTNDTTTNATMYPTWVTASTGNLPQKVSSTKLTFNPSTGTLAATTISGIASTPASTTATAGLKVPHGSAPTAPANGDIWTTAAGVYARVNGATVGPLGTGGGGGDMLKSENLSGLADYTTARTNLGLGTMATETAANYQLVSAKGAASGYASLDAGTKIPIAQIPTGTTGSTVSLGDHAHATLATLASPTFTGTPLAPTAASGTNTTQIATTEFVNTEISADAVLKSNAAGGTASKVFVGNTDPAASAAAGDIWIQAVL